MPLDGRSFIGPERVAGSGAAFQAVDPATGEAIDPAYGSVAPDVVDRAVALAAAAFTSYARSDGRTRATLLRAIADALAAEEAALVARVPLETALPGARVKGELGRTVGQLRMFADLVEEGSWVDARIDHADPDRAPLPKPDVRSMLRPLGPVAVFGASNFPLAFSTAGGDTASALAAGCPVIVKAHPAHPGTSEIVAGAIGAALDQVGAPAGLFSLLYDAGHDVGRALVTHSGIRAVGFTGSRRGGRALMDLAAERPDPIPVFAEMGSVNPVFVLPGAMAGSGESIADGLAASITLGGGQFCTNPGLVFVDQATAGAFVGRLETALAEAAPATLLTPAIAASYRAGVQHHTRATGVAVGPWTETAGPSVHPVLLRTTATAFRTNPTLREEIFGPASLVVGCDGVEEMTELARGLEGQLTATVHAAVDDHPKAAPLLEVLAHRAGRVLLGGVPTGVEVGPAMVHGGPYPATSDGRSTSVGTAAILRFARPVAYQNVPDALLPEALRSGNPLGLMRQVNGVAGRH